jgi:hypothetical protein
MNFMRRDRFIEPSSRLFTRHRKVSSAIRVFLFPTFRALPLKPPWSEGYVAKITPNCRLCAISPIWGVARVFAPFDRMLARGAPFDGAAA